MKLFVAVALMFCGCSADIIRGPAHVKAKYIRDHRSACKVSTEVGDHDEYSSMWGSITREKGYRIYTCENLTQPLVVSNDEEQP